MDSTLAKAEPISAGGSDRNENLLSTSAQRSDNMREEQLQAARAVKNEGQELLLCFSFQQEYCRMEIISAR